MLLSIEHVAKTHWVGPYEKPTLVDACLAVGAGRFVAVWGAQRSGKSTLLRLAAGLSGPDRGIVRFKGVDLAELSNGRRGALRLRDIGVVQSEGPQSREFRVVDYVALPLLRGHTRGVAQKKALVALHRVGVAEGGEATWSQLSDGERSLVSLAHGLVREPRLLLVDDPTAGLDTLQQEEVVGLLRSAAVETGIGVLMTSSVLSAIARAHEQFTLSDGRLAAVTDPLARAGRVIGFPGRRQTA